MHSPNLKVIQPFSKSIPKFFSSGWKMKCKTGILSKSCTPEDFGKMFDPTLLFALSHWLLVHIIIMWFVLCTRNVFYNWIVQKRMRVWVLLMFIFLLYSALWHKWLWALSHFLFLFFFSSFSIVGWFSGLEILDLSLFCLFTQLKK